MLKTIRITVILALLSSPLMGQVEIGKTFYDTRIVNGQSVETNNEGVMKFIIAHRFGPVNGGDTRPLVELHDEEWEEGAN